jgi:hypothetical protein
VSGVRLYLISYFVALALVRSTPRVALTWMRAFSKILAFSSLTERESSLRVSSSSCARSPSTAIVDGATTAGPDDKEGGSSLHKAYRDKSGTHEGTFQPTARDG